MTVDETTDKEFLAMEERFRSLAKKKPGIKAKLKTTVAIGLAIISLGLYAPKADAQTACRSDTASVSDIFMRLEPVGLHLAHSDLQNLN